MERMKIAFILDDVTYKSNYFYRILFFVDFKVMWGE